MSQEYLPTKVATAAGMSIGLAMGFGGAAAVILGAIADTVDLRAALLVTAAGPIIGAVFALWLPGRRAFRGRPVLSE
jgi:MFS transporter, FSR family, fosmidomycin resistance protein